MNEPRKDAEKTDAAQPPRPDVGQGTITPHADPTATVDGPAPLKHEDRALFSLPGEPVECRPPLGVTSDQTTDQPSSASTPNCGFSGATLDYVSQKAIEPPANGDIYLGETVDQVSALESAHSEPKADVPSPVPAVGPLAGPQNIAGYEILGVLGRGAMGVVYKARQRGLKRIVALKMIKAGDEADENELLRFRTEAESAGQLQHPNIVQVHEVGWHNGCPYLSLEFVHGGSLKDRLNGTPQPVQAAAQLTQVLAQAIDYAHRQGVVHRDLKPGNVMLEPPRGDGSTVSSMSATPLVDQLYGTPKVADFGLAKRLEEDSGQTRSGTILGTPSYMAPEQAFGLSKDVGPLADQHALGAVLYELLTGRPPFRGATMWETIEQVQKQEPVPPSRLQPKVPRDLETICLKCLQKEPTRRYKDAAALAEDLRRFVAGEPILARPVSTPERLMRWCRRNPKVASLIGTVFVLLLTGIIGLAYFNIQLAAEKEAERIAKEEAKTNENIAMGQRKLLLDSLTTVMEQIYDKLRDKPRLQALRRELLKTALKDYDQVAENRDVEISKADVGKAKVQMELGQLYLGAGEVKKAFEHNQRGHEIFKALVQKAPSSDGAKANLTLPLMQMGYLLLRMNGDIEGARAKFLEAKAILEDLDQNPQDKTIPPHVIKAHLSAALQRLGSVTIDSNPQEALGYYQSALKYRLALRDLAKDKKRKIDAEATLADVYLMVGGAWFCLRDEDAARKNYDLALEISERLAQENRDQRDIQRNLGFALQRYGDLDLRTNRFREAHEKYARARDIYQQLVQEDPEVTEYQDDLARANYDLGNVALREKNPKEAENCFRLSLKTRKERADADPDDLSAKKNYMTALARCGEHVAATKIADEILKVMEDGDSLIEAANCYAVSAGAAEKDRNVQRTYLLGCLEALQKAVGKGYRNIVNLETEPDLDSVRQKPEFQAFLAELRKTLTVKGASGT